MDRKSRIALKHVRIIDVDPVAGRVVTKGVIVTDSRRIPIPVIKKVG